MTIAVGTPVIVGAWSSTGFTVGNMVLNFEQAPCYVERAVSIKLEHNGFGGNVQPWTGFPPQQQARILRDYAELFETKLGAYRQLGGSTDQQQLFRRAVASGQAAYIDRRILWPNVPANLIAWLPAPVRLPLAISLVVVGGALWFVGRRRCAVGACLHCGYDLGGTPGADRCPECGRLTREVNRPIQG